MRAFRPVVAIASISQFGPGPLLVEADMADLRLLLLDLQSGKVVSTSANMFTMPSASTTLTAHFKTGQ
jgi:hypothetical protein